MIRHPRDAQGTTELAPLPARSIPHSVLEVFAILIAIRLLHSNHMVIIPMIPHQSRNQQLLPQIITFRRRDGVVQQHSVPDGLVDYPVEDVC